MSVFATAIEKLQMYVGDGWQYLVFAAALLFICLGQYERRIKVFLVGYTLLFWFIYLCPLTAGIIMEYCVGEDVYWRMLWLLPVPLVIACASTGVSLGFSGRFGRIAMALILAVVIAVSGTCVYTAETTPFVRAENLNKLPSDVIDICNQINEHRDGSYACVTAPYELVSDIRQYDAGICLTYGRRTGSRRQRKLLGEMLAEKPNFRRILRLSRKLQGNYLVYASSDSQHERLLRLGYVQIGQHEPYRIYYDASW